MDDSSTTSPFFSYVFCIVAYFVAIFSNEISIMEHMHLLDISFTEYDQIIFFKLLGRITAAIILLLFVRVFSFKKIIICSILLYFISVFNIIFIETSHEIMVLFFFLYTATTVVVSTLLLGYILIDDKIDDNYSISVYAISLLVAYIIAETFEYFTLSNSDAYYIPELMASNIIPIGVFLSMLFISPAYGHKIDLDNYRFFSVIKRIEMEILVGFTVFYIVMIVQNGYEVYALADSLTILTDTTREYLRLCSVILAIIVTTAYVPRFNKHKVSIVCIVSLILLFVSMPQWGEYSISTIIGRVVLITSLYMLFACSLLSLAEKFRGINLFSAISIYSLGSVFGYYCGYVTIDTSENTLGVNGFLISICFVLIGLLFYYSYLYKKHKLYR